jgi:hypothetical protein
MWRTRWPHRQGDVMTAPKESPHDVAPRRSINWAARLGSSDRSCPWGSTSRIRCRVHGIHSRLSGCWFGFRRNRAALAPQPGPTNPRRKFSQAHWSAYFCDIRNNRRWCRFGPLSISAPFWPHPAPAQRSPSRPKSTTERVDPPPWNYIQRSKSSCNARSRRKAESRVQSLRRTHDSLCRCPPGPSQRIGQYLHPNIPADRSGSDARRHRLSPHRVQLCAARRPAPARRRNRASPRLASGQDRPKVPAGGAARCTTSRRVDRLGDPLFLTGFGPRPSLRPNFMGDQRSMSAPHGRK